MMALEALTARAQAARRPSPPAGPVGTLHLGEGARLGLPLGAPVTVGPIEIPDADRSGHLGCFGTTRVGKTRLIESLVEQDIRKGYSVLIIDPKGDHELMNRVVQTAVETGRLDEVMLLTPIFPEVSIHVGPLTSYYMQDELVNMLISGVKAKEDYFVAIAQEVSQVIVAGMVALRQADQDPRPLTFMDVKERIGFKDLVAFSEELARVPGTDHIRRSILQMIQSPNLADFWAKVSSSFRTTLSALTFGAVGEIMGRATVNPVVERLERGRPVIVVAQTGSLLTQRTSVLVGKMLVSMIQALIGRLFSSGRALTPPLCLHIDEGHNVLYAGFQELINKGGGANCWVHFYTQSVAQIEAEVGPEYARSIIDNINTWIYLLVNHPETAQHIEATSPLRYRYEPVMQMGGDVTIRTTEGPAIRADRVLRLPKRWFYCRSYGKVWKGRTPEVTPTWLKVRWPVIRPQAAPGPAEAEAPSSG
ncbi:type IV secretory system conjugative DNA transfer family protein [Nitrospira calida]|jgi:hypothetical protein